MNATNVVGLRCRECGAPEDIAPVHVCSLCFGPLEVVYDEERVAARVSLETVAAGPPTMWRYAEMLPVLDGTPVGGLPTGWTPLVPAPRLADRIGIGELWLKDDTRNPSGSFKDRVVSVALAAARALGIDTLACASTGNLANAVAAHAANAGMPAYVFIPHDLEQAKIVTSAVYGATIVAIKGNYDDVNRLCAELADARAWGFVNVNLRPYYAEGSKTLGFEVAEQLGLAVGADRWVLPDHVVVPIASGAQLVKVARAFDLAARYGLADRRPVRISGAQPSGCSPVATAFKEGTEVVRPVKPQTVARSLAIGNPADGHYAVRAVRTSGGAVEDVTDAEIVAGIRLLAETEGMFAETAGGVTIATLAKLARHGHIGRDERVVAFVTGHGLKTVDAVSADAGPTVTVGPSLSEVEERLALLEQSGGA